MAEYTNSGIVAVAAGQNLPLTETAVKASPCVVHREGAGIVTLRGTGNQCRARYYVSFGGNIAIPAGGAVEAISVALSVGGEALGSATAMITPAAAEQYGNVFTAAYIDVPCRCCANVAVTNTSAQTINIANANLIVTREA